MHNKKISTTLILLFFGLSLCLNFNVSDNSFNYSQKTPESAEVLGPLTFYMNWASMISTYPLYVSGAGTFEDPYLIQNAVINAQNSGSGIFIQMTGVNEYIVVRNCTITNSSTGSEHAGIRLDQCNNVIIENCSLFNNTNGIYMSNTDNFTIQNNFIYNNTNGINFYNQCTNGTIYRNNCTSNYYGFNVFYSSQNNFTENTVDENTYISIYVHYSEMNQFRNNYVYSHINNAGTYQTSGINLYMANTTTIDANYVNSFFRDIEFYNSFYCIILNNTIRNDYETGSSIGISLSDSPNNTIQGNYLRDSDYGINMANSQYIVCSNNTLSPIEFYGLYCSSSFNVTISNNTIQMNDQGGNYARDGIIIDASNNFTVFNNNVSKSLNYAGIRIGPSSQNGTIAWNKLSNNGIGIHVYSSASYNNFSFNQITDSYSNAVYFENVAFNTFVYNNITNSNMYGIYLSSSSYNEIAYNKIRQSGYSPIYQTGNNDNVHNNDMYELSAQFTINASKLYVNRTYEFDASSTTGDTPINYYWVFGDGGTGNNAAIVTHTYNNTGIYSFNLTIEDGSGESTFVSQQITVHAYILPTLEINASSIIINVSSIVYFTSTMVGGDTPYSYHWYFGDGSYNSTIASPSHQFTSIGDFTVICMVVDFQGEILIKSIQIQVISPPNVPSIPNPNPNPDESSSDETLDKIMEGITEFFQKPTNVAYTGGGVLVLILYGLYKGRGNKNSPKAPKKKKPSFHNDDEPMMDFKF